MEMAGLANHGPEASHPPHEPLQHIVAALRIGLGSGKKFSGLVGKIDQHGAGLEDGSFLAAYAVAVDHRGDAVVGAYLEKILAESVARTDIDAMNGIIEAVFLQHDMALVTVPHRPSIEIYHRALRHFIDER